MKVYEEAVIATTKEEADVYLAKIELQLIEDNPKLSLKEANKIAKDNIGYYSGYYSDVVRRRVELLYETKHPILGRAGEISPEIAFRLGQIIGNNSKEDLFG